MQNQQSEKKEEKEEPKVIIPPEKITEVKPLVEQVKDLKDTLDKLTGAEPTKLIKKNFKFNRLVKRNTRNLKKMMEKNKVLVILLKISKGIQPTIGEISMGRLIVGDFYYNAAKPIIWLWNGKIPTAIVPEWDMQPITQDTLMETTEKLKTWLHPQTIILRQIEAREIEEKGKGFKFSPVLIIVIAVILIAAWWLFFGGN